MRPPRLVDLMEDVGIGHDIQLRRLGGLYVVIAQVLSLRYGGVAPVRSVLASLAVVRHLGRCRFTGSAPSRTLIV